MPTTKEADFIRACLRRTPVSKTNAHLITFARDACLIDGLGNLTSRGEDLVYRGLIDDAEKTDAKRAVPT